MNIVLMDEQIRNLMLDEEFINDLALAICKNSAWKASKDLEKLVLESLKNEEVPVFKNTLDEIRGSIGVLVKERFEKTIDKIIQNRFGKMIAKCLKEEGEKN